MLQRFQLHLRLPIYSHYLLQVWYLFLISDLYAIEIRTPNSKCQAESPVPYFPASPKEPYKSGYTISKMGLGRSTSNWLKVMIFPSPRSRSPSSKCIGKSHSKYLQTLRSHNSHSSFHSYCCYGYFCMLPGIRLYCTYFVWSQSK